jgi:hypothetical protein
MERKVWHGIWKGRWDDRKDVMIRRRRVMKLTGWKGRGGM